MVSEKYAVGDYSIDIFNYPVITMDKKRQESLTQKCTKIAKNGFGNPYIHAEDVKSRILNSSSSLFIKDKYRNIIGFSCVSLKYIENYHIIYLQGSVFRRDHQNKSLHHIVTPLRIIKGIEQLKKHEKYIDTSRILISGRTQNPRAYRVLHRKIGFISESGWQHRSSPARYS